MQRGKKKIIRSRDLGIDLESCRERELFRWLLACLLFGKPIQQEIARAAFLEFDRARLTSPDAVLDAGWDKLVELLDRAHYVRYDFSTATKILGVCGDLTQRHGTVKRMIDGCPTPASLSGTLQEFRGIGPVTAGIFVRDVRTIWSLLKKGPSGHRKVQRTRTYGPR